MISGAAGEFYRNVRQSRAKSNLRVPHDRCLQGCAMRGPECAAMWLLSRFAPFRRRWTALPSQNRSEVRPERLRFANPMIAKADGCVSVSCRNPDAFGSGASRAPVVCAARRLIVARAFSGCSGVVARLRLGLSLPVSASEVRVSTQPESHDNGNASDRICY